MLVGGGGGPVWNGQIQVYPGDLEASAPGFDAASGQTLESRASIFPWGEAGSTGITDSQAGAAWGRLTTVWLADLNTLGNELENLSVALYAAGDAYQANDQSVMPSVPGGGHPR